jgi:hypothetical protein
MDGLPNASMYEFCLPRVKELARPTSSKRKEKKKLGLFAKYN